MLFRSNKTSQKRLNIPIFDRFCEVSQRRSAVYSLTRGLVYSVADFGPFCVSAYSMTKRRFFPLGGINERRLCQIFDCSYKTGLVYCL